MCSKSLTRSCGLAVLCKELGWGQSFRASHRNQLYRPMFSKAEVLAVPLLEEADVQNEECVQRYLSSSETCLPGRLCFANPLFGVDTINTEETLKSE